jgi:hypothetical protein
MIPMTSSLSLFDRYWRTAVALRSNRQNAPDDRRPVVIVRVSFFAMRLVEHVCIRYAVSANLIAFLPGGAAMDGAKSFVVTCGRHACLPVCGRMSRQSSFAAILLESRRVRLDHGPS